MLAQRLGPSADLAAPPRTLGIDFGEARIGLAISDPAGRYALPLATLERTSDRAAIGAIRELVRREGVTRLIVGEPRHPDDGTPSPAAERIRRFAARLARACGLPYELIEETLTTVEAAALLRREKGREPARQALDAVAAQLLLQEALDRWPARD